LVLQQFQSAQTQTKKIFEIFVLQRFQKFSWFGFERKATLSVKKQKQKAALSTAFCFCFLNYRKMLMAILKH
jgi:hypothetical protein